MTNLPSLRRRSASLPYGPFVRLFNALLGFALLLTLAAAPASAQTAAPAQQRLLVLGDSLTAGYGLEPRDGFTAQLERALRARGHHVTVINGGRDGDTAAGGRARLEWSLGARPTAVIVELGANDGLRGSDTGQLYDNLAAILKTLQARDLPVLLAGMLAPPNFGAAYGRDFRAVYTRLAADFGVPLYPFFLDGVAAEPSLNQPDGIHPNAQGVAVIVERILPHVERLLETARAAG